MRKIAIEEHITGKEAEKEEIEKRLKDMDKAGLDMQVLSFGMGHHAADMDSSEVVSMARSANDMISRIIERYPTKFSGFAALPIQEPEIAVNEFERAVKQLGLKGAMIFASQAGEYLDGEKYLPIFEKAEKLDVPIYLHPGALLPDMREPYMTYPVLSHAMWGFSAGTGLQAMRLICSGLFVKYPGLKLILGHMGEGIPYYLWRIDNHWEKGKEPGIPGSDWVINSNLQKKPGEYFKDNFYVTTSGMFWHPALQLAHSALGSDRILFAVDYPNESTEEAVRFIESAVMSDSDKENICHLNAERLFGLKDCFS